MIYVPANSLEERTKRLLQLRLRIQEIKNKFGYPEKDGREKILNNITWIIASVVMKMNIALEYNNNPQIRPTIQKLIGLSQGDLKTPLEVDVDITRMSFITMFQFQLETLMKILLAEFSTKKLPQGFYDISKELLTVLSIKNIDYKLDVLNALAYMRNCLHSNGVHNKPTKTFDVNGLKLEFIENKLLKVGKWEEICHLANESISIIGEILETPKVSDLKGTLSDVYIPKTKN